MACLTCWPRTSSSAARSCDAPYEGRDRVRPLLHAVARVFDEFQFIRRIGDAHEGDHALVFRARIGEREVEGCDFVHTNEAGLIDEFYVMVRPLSAATALAEAMQSQLAPPTTRASEPL
jgi:hypothetical protein